MKEQKQRFYCWQQQVGECMWDVCVQERELELQKEQRRQEENDKLRQEFAQHANAFHQWLQETR